MQREDLVLSDDSEKGRDERLTCLERRLEHLNAGLGLLGVKPCSSCGIYYRRSEEGTLFNCGELVCYDCVPQWWSHRGLELSTDDRQKAERQLRHWLVSHHHAEVIEQSGDLPEAERLLMKLITGCEQCNASGEIHGGKRCTQCEGRGTVWVVIVRPPDA